VNPTPPTPLEGSQQLKSPSGRAPFRVAPPMPTPVVVKRVNPQYSPEAMQARIEGTVAVEALVDEQGHVADARVLTSIPLLDKSALDAARQWEFTPTLLNGQPVPVLLMLEMHFTLK
jgi:protein TonB